MTHAVTVRHAGDADRPWVDDHLSQVYSTEVARRGELVRPTDHPMLIAEAAARPVGLLTFIVHGDACEILTLHAVAQWQGTGTSLVDAVKEEARRAGCRTLWVLTTNDNVDALRFYQRRGFRIRVVRPGAVGEARRELKPAIPATGEYGIPIRDEIELEQPL